MRYNRSYFELTERNEMTKPELRAALMNDQITFLLQGGRITECAPQKATAKIVCRAKETRNRATGGNMPTYRTSVTFN